MVSKDKIKNKFKKVCINSYPSHDKVIQFVKNPITDKLERKLIDRGPMMYRHPDLYKLSKEAYDKGEEFFYCEPKNPNDPYGDLILCEPKYEYELVEGLTVEEFEVLFI